jgi:hypothetical protein
MKASSSITYLARALVVAGLVIAGVGCGAAQPVEVVVTPFTSQHEAVFENGVDLIRDPEGADGGWLASWEEDTDRRVTLADVVAVVTVRTLRTDVDLDRNETYRVIVHVDRELLGHMDEEITLAVREGESGYASVRTNVDRVLEQPFVAFVKWQRDDDGAIRPRWHLSPASDPVVRRVRELLSSRRHVSEYDGSRRTVIIRNN